MSGREPEWFKPEPFSREVLLHAFRQLGVIPPAPADDLNQYPEEFREAVQTIGQAVFTLQLIIRNRVRPLFIETMNLLVDVVHGDIYGEIFRFMHQSYLHQGIFKTTLSCFAIIAELILFLFEFGHAVPFYWIPMPFCAIYEYRLRLPLEESGGWERLLEVVRTRYIDNEFYEETYLSYVNNNPIPHAEVRGLENWPQEPPEILYNPIPGIPRNTTLAMRILREIYKDRQLTPTPGAGAYAIRSMLGLPHPEEDERV